MIIINIIVLSKGALTLRWLMAIYVTFDPYAVGSVFLALRNTPNVCNWKPMKMAKNCRDASVGNGKNFEKQAQPSKG